MKINLFILTICLEYVIILGDGASFKKDHENFTLSENYAVLNKTKLYDADSTHGIGDLNNSSIPNLVSTPSIIRSNGLISEEQYDDFMTVIGYVKILLSLAGILINICNIFVFIHPRMKNSTRFYLIAISFFQVVYIGMSLVISIHSFMYDKTEQKRTKFYNEYGIYITNYVGVAILRTIYCLVMLLTFERLIVTAFPMTHHNFRFQKAPVRIIIGTFLLNILYRIGVLLKFKVIETTNDDGETAYSVAYTDFYHPVMEDLHLAGKISFVYVPLAGIFISNILLCIVLRINNIRRAALQEGSSPVMMKEKQTTVAIIVSTCLFLFLTLTTTTNSLVGLFRSDWNYFSQNKLIYLFVNELGETLSLLSFLVDFFVYITISSRFRETFILRCLGCRKERVLEKTFTSSISVSKAN